MTRSAQDRLTDIQMAIARVYSYRPSLKGEHSERAVETKQANLLSRTDDEHPHTGNDRQGCIDNRLTSNHY